MGDFFYYGQKDTIQRLNELAGRGAVVASYAPKVGMSPVGGPNGFMNPAWLDPDIAVRTNKPLSVGTTAKYGYQFTSSAGQRNWYKLATFAQDDSGNQEHLMIRGTLNDQWLSAQTSAVTILMGVRNGFYVDWHIEGRLRGNARIIVYKNQDLTHSVYAFLDGFANATFDVAGRNVWTYDTPVITGSPGPEGTVVFDTSATPPDPAYIAPRWQGVAGRSAGARATIFSDVLFTGGVTSKCSSFIAGAADSGIPGPLETLRLGVSGVDGSAYPGHYAFLTTPGNQLYTQGYKLDLNAYDSGSGNWTSPLLTAYGDGRLFLPVLKAGSSDTSTARHHISRGTGQGQEIIYFGVDQSPAPSVAILASDGRATWAGPIAVLYVGKNSVTGRGIASGGTITGQGSDVAEYFWKCLSCGDVKAGQIIGINNKNQITDLWAEAVMFAIKSTDPSFVGGDNWSKNVGQRPSPKAGPEPTQPLRREDVVTQQPVPGTNPPEYENVVSEPGDTDDEWAEKQATYTAALAAHNIVVQQDAEAMATFDAALEVERQKVDRIAIAGRVPVNVQGAQPGDYIVPMQDGAGIQGIAVHEDELTMKQYMHAVGRVISIEPDGRAYVMVKVV